MISDQDHRLLMLLRSNARASISDLARELNLSRSTVQNRIQKLETTGVIKGYSVDYGSEYSESLVCAHIHIKVKQKLTAKTNQQLQKISYISALYAVNGEFDFIAVIQAKSLQQLSKIIDDIGQFEGVERTNSSIIMETKFSR